MRRLLIVLALAGVLLCARAAAAEDVCLDAGALGPLAFELPALCVPVP